MPFDIIVDILYALIEISRRQTSKLPKNTILILLLFFAPKKSNKQSKMSTQNHTKV